MKAIWVVPILASILILGTLGISDDAFAGKGDNNGNKGCDNANIKSKACEKNPNTDPSVFCDSDFDGEGLGNVIVPAGAACSLNSVEIAGYLKSDGAKSIFVIFSGIAGDVSIQNPTVLVQLLANVVGGDVTFTGATGGTATIEIFADEISGDVKFTDNELLNLRFDPREILGNLVITGNLVINGVIIGGNNDPMTIEGDVLCDGNTGVSWDSSNIVLGTFSGDCPIV